MIKTIQIVASINAEASGPSYSVTRLCEAVSAQGGDVALHVLEPAPEIPFKTYKIHAHPAWPLVPRLGISPNMRKALADSAKKTQIMHNHSLWMMPNIYPVAVAVFFIPVGWLILFIKAHTVISDGMMSFGLWFSIGTILALRYYVATDRFPVVDQRRFH